MREIAGNVSSYMNKNFRCVTTKFADIIEIIMDG